MTTYNNSEENVQIPLSQMQYDVTAYVIPNVTITDHVVSDGLAVAR